MKQLLLLLVLALTGCGAADFGFVPAVTPTPTCEAGLPAFAQTLDPLAREWDDANKVASSTPRSALSAQIGALQSVRRRVQDIAAPPCGAEMKEHLVKTMNATIDGYIAFLGQKSDPVVNAFFETAKTEMDAYQAASLTAMLPAATAVP